MLSVVFSFVVLHRYLTTTASLCWLTLLCFLLLLGISKTSKCTLLLWVDTSSVDSTKSTSERSISFTSVQAVRIDARSVSQSSVVLGNQTWLQFLTVILCYWFVSTFIVLGLVSSVLCWLIGWEELLWNDIFVSNRSQNLYALISYESCNRVNHAWACVLYDIMCNKCITHSVQMSVKYLWWLWRYSLEQNEEEGYRTLPALESGWLFPLPYSKFYENLFTTVWAVLLRKGMNCRQ